MTQPESDLNTQEGRDADRRAREKQWNEMADAADKEAEGRGGSASAADEDTKLGETIVPAAIEEVAVDEVSEATDSMPPAK